MAAKQKPYPKRHRRKNQTRNIRKKYLIITEGHTEKAYFDHFQTSTKLEIIVENPAVTKQLGLVNKAIEIRDERLKNGSFILDNDETWVVIDRDVEKSNPHDLDNFNKAHSLAKKHNIQLALSNDSFELWYLLHYQDVSSPMHRRDLDKKLSKYLGRTYKSKNAKLIEDLYVVLRPLREAALKIKRK
jgi:hypothetical protein